MLGVAFQVAGKPAAGPVGPEVVRVTAPPPVEPLGPTGTPQYVTSTVRDGNGFGDIKIIYFLMNLEPNIPKNTCHGYYERDTNAFFLYRDNLESPMGPLKPGPDGKLENSQCVIYAANSGIASTAGSELTIRLGFEMKGEQAARYQNFYLLAKDNAMAETGWVRTGGWVPPQTVAVRLPGDGKVTVGAGKGTERLLVSTAIPMAGWRAKSNAEWLEVVTRTGGGNATLVFRHAANAGAARMGTVTVGDQTLTVTQAAAGTAAPEVTGEPFVSKGTSETIRVRFRHEGGVDKLGALNVLINGNLNGEEGCLLSYSQPEGKLRAVKEGGAGPAMALGVQGMASGRNCVVYGQGSGVKTVGTDTLELALNLSFAPVFGGRKLVFAEARDVRDVSSGWVVAGMHEVPEGLVKPPRVNVSLPAAGKGTAGAITFLFDDASDVSNLQTVWVVMGKGVEGKQACSVAYHVPDNAVYLLPDDGDGARAKGVEMTLANAVENGQCRVSAAGSAAMKTGPRLTLTLQYTFKPGFEGTWGIWTALQTKEAKATTGWKVSGVWTVPGE